MSSVDEIPNGWSEEILVDCLESLIDYRGKTPKKSDSGILTLSAKSVKMGYVDYSQAYYISTETYKSFMVRGFPKVGDVLMTTEAPLGCIARLDRDDVGIAQRLLTLRGKENLLDNDYLRYYLTSRRGQHELKSRASGSTVQGIKRTEFEKVEILLPKYEEQKAIANILTAFDDKIENLQAQNNTLEQTAQTIFAAWFGKYQVGDELPDGWRVGKIYDVLDVQYGYPFKSKLFNEKKKGLPLIRIRDIRKGATGYFTDEEYLDEYIVNSGDVLAGMDAVFKPYLWAGQKGLLNQRVCRFVPKEFASRIFVFEFMKPHLSFYEKTKVGTTVIHLGKSDLDFIETVIPSDDVILKFKELSSPIEEKIINNQQQIQTLKKTRDTLLPKLMSGQLRVNGFKE